MSREQDTYLKDVEFEVKDVLILKIEALYSQLKLEN